MLVSADYERNKMQIYLLFPQGPLTAEVSKAVGEVGLVASVFEAKCGPEVDQRWFVHLVTVFKKNRWFLGICLLLK